MNSLNITIEHIWPGKANKSCNAETDAAGSVCDTFLYSLEACYRVVKLRPSVICAKKKHLLHMDIITYMQWHAEPHRQHGKHICIVVDPICHAIFALAALSVQPEACHSTGEQPGREPYFVFSEANGGEGGLDWGA